MTDNRQIHCRKPAARGGANRMVVLAIGGAVLILMLFVVILMALDSGKGKEPLRSGTTQPSAQTPSEPKPLPVPIDISHPPNYGSSEMFPGVPAVHFDENGKPINPPQHSAPR